MHQLITSLVKLGWWIIPAPVPWKMAAGVLVVSLGFATVVQAADPPLGKPNVVFILCDDLGYGDVKCNNPAGKIPTPNIDRLAAEGMRFTDAHTTSSVCTPSRYGLLTGRYNWRSRLQTFVIGAMSPHLIEPSRITVAELLQRQGYHTACIGKWHLGMDWPRRPGTPAFTDEVWGPNANGWNVDFTKPIANGPNSVGFNYAFVISGVLNIAPYTFVENNRVTAVPTVDKSFPMMLGQKEHTQLGPSAANFEAMDVLPTLTHKAVQYIAQRAGDAKAGKPFFLYFPLTAPHTPILPTPEWQGQSGLNPYGDFVMEVDACVGQVIRALDENGVADNTLVVFTSDNGFENGSPPGAGLALMAKGHNPSSILRGYKYDIWDGGHRVPYIVRWPGKVRPGSTSDQLICLVDFMATCAEIVGQKLPDSAGEDSVSILPVLLGKAGKPPREALVHHSTNGKFAIRQDRWKLELCPGSGGNSAPLDSKAAKLGLPRMQLYDMTEDIGEQRNLQAEHPEVVRHLIQLLEKYVADGRSTPGEPQKNDAVVDIWKPEVFSSGK